MFTKPFKELGKGDAHLAGGKGASLGEMTQAGIPVPPGFVLLAPAFEQFLKETDLGVEIDAVLHTVNHQEIHTVDAASERIKSLILSAKMPEDIAKEIKREWKKLGATFVAVRSSATAEDSSEAAWAGQLDTFLNTTDGELLKNVQRCWASLFTPRAIFYRFEKELHKSKISVAVVVQKMVDSEISGIAFSVHPVTEDYNQLIIEAGFGLGEAIVSGQITPDSYVVHKTKRFILDKNVVAQERGLFKKAGGGNDWKTILPTVGEKQTLSDTQILSLSEIVIDIEKHYGFPCDIEWAFEKGKFYITQSRPITTLSKKKPSGVWVRNFSADRCGVQLVTQFFENGMWEFQRILFGKNTPLLIDDGFVYMQGPRIVGGYYREEQLQALVDALMKVLYAEPERILKNHRESYKLNDGYMAYGKSLLSIDFAKDDGKKLAKRYLELTDWQERAHEHSLGSTWYVDSMGGTFANLLLERTKELIVRCDSKRNPAEVFTILTTPERQSYGQKEEYASLTLLASIQADNKASRIFKDLHTYERVPAGLSERFHRAIEKHVETWQWTPFGYLGPAYGVDYYLSVWAGLVRENCDAQKERKKLAGREALIRKQKREIVKELAIPADLQKIYEMAADITFLKGYRKDTSYFGFFVLDRLFDEIGKRLHIPKADVHLLTHREIEALLSSQTKADRGELARRKKHMVLVLRDGKIAVISGDEAEQFMREKTIAQEAVEMSGDAYKGTCASAGKARGVVKIVNRPEEMHKMNKGDIMVAHTTFPALVPAMKKAAAIVTEDGGITCHAAIVARELKIPCVTGIKAATEIFKDGDVVEVDADNATVRKVSNVASGALATSGRESYKNLEFRKLGNWATYPLDIELWHTEHTSAFFERVFGVWREILAVNTYKKGVFELNHMFTTVRFTEKLHDRIRELTAKDPKGLEKILLRFYTERKATVAKLHALNPKDVSKLSNDKLVALYRKNRRLAHNIVVYDQFTWLAEEYWHPLLEDVLVNKAGLKKASPEYTTALFALIKPREISTTLSEKKAVIEEALALKAKKTTVEKSSAKLAQRFGWMPVLAYGTPWEAKHYAVELAGTMKKEANELKKELATLTHYTKLRDRDFREVSRRYELTKAEQQIFIDFGLAIDVRNEAEYVGSVAGFYVLPLYKEFMKRLKLSITKLRTLREDEIVSCLQGTSDPKKILKEKGNVVSWFVDADTRSRIIFTPEEGADVFAHVESQREKTEAARTVLEKRGITANTGKVKGRVCRVPSPEENHKVREGDILIAYSTMVDNLPAMKKAAAFVTESGGLTCHAAVVAREFGVPCIVGMKDAMSDFKDGDVVEVDADKGIVRLVKGKNSSYE
jgi:phosphoenolpyruvate synthase/pyruvate phosphate dikinase